MSVVIIDNDSFIDSESHTVAIQIDRVTVSLNVEEFLDFFRTVSDIKLYLESSPDYVIGKETDTETGEVSDIIIPKPDDDDYT